MYSKRFIRISWFTLIFLFLATTAGSLVRITGSGMGCPDWPKCFGQVVPPTSADQIPSDYKEIYSEKRSKKLYRFTNFLEKLGFSEEAKNIRNDKSLLEEQDFNAAKTWTEYGNRVVGVFSGFGCLFVFAGLWFRYKNKNLRFWATLNLVILIIQAWFGSIVVASNLVPWTITLHMFLALVLIAIQAYIVYRISPKQQVLYHLPAFTRINIWVCLVITFVQIFLGTQVREMVDRLTKLGYERSQWVDMLGTEFLIHRTFSWIVLALLTMLLITNLKEYKIRLITSIFIVLVLELIAGICLSYLNMPGLVQTAHLIFAILIFTQLFMLTLRIRAEKK